MPHFPPYDEFAELATSHTVVPVYRRLVADALTPVLALRRMAGGDWRFLFESVVGGERIGRYSFLGERPFRRFEAFGHRVREKVGDAAWTEAEHPDPLKLLEERVAEYRAPKLTGVPPFCTAAVGFVGYDAVRYVEKLPNAPPDDRQLPDLCFGFFGGMVVFDHINKTLLVVASVRVPELTARTTHATLKDAYADACAWVDDTVARLGEHAAADRDALRLQDIHVPASYAVPERYTSNFTPESWNAMIGKGIEYIRAGDVFQYVPSQRFHTTTTADSFDIYRALRVINPSPFMFYLDTGGVTLVGASPEILCRVENREMTVRPLAGTRRRGATVAEDQQLAAELIADPKERAEHIMLVDLGRNDIGKVCEVGSVRLADLMIVERYSHVMHISSTVTGTLQRELTAFDALRSALPAGTLSGAPKVRAMEVIDELEPHRRGPYGGAVGYVDFTGNMDTCIALRTMVIQGDAVYIQAGCGVVADSDADAEYQETVNKAMGLMRAVEVAETQLG